MAQYEHLPIYKKAMDLTVYIENMVRGFSRYHKYTLGTDLRNLSREIVRLIIKANSERDRLAINPLYRFCRIFPSARSQYLYYANMFKAMVLFFQVGRFYEFYSELNEDVKETIGLTRLKEGKRGAKYGFPIMFEAEYAERLIEKGLPVVIIKETDRYIGKIKERLPVMKITKIKEGKRC